MSVSFMERCNGNVESGKGVERCDSCQYILRDDLTFIVSVSLRKYDIFS